MEYENAFVTRVVDGDTMETDDGQHLRYVGIDTPEREEPYYWAALQANSSLATNKEIRLKKDVEDRDTNGRLLRYAWVGDRMINAKLVQQGYAYSHSYGPNLKYQEYFLRLAKEALEQI